MNSESNSFELRKAALKDTLIIIFFSQLRRFEISEVSTSKSFETINWSENYNYKMATIY